MKLTYSVHIGSLIVDEGLSYNEARALGRLLRAEHNLDGYKVLPDSKTRQRVAEAARGAEFATVDSSSFAICQHDGMVRIGTPTEHIAIVLAAAAIEAY